MVKWLLHFSFVLADRCRVPMVTIGSPCKIWAVAYDGGLQIWWERRAEVHIGDWFKSTSDLWRTGREGNMRQHSLFKSKRQHRNTKKVMKEEEGNRWRRENWGGEEHLKEEKANSRMCTHSHDGWALPVRRYVAVPRCPLGPVGWHSNWMCSDRGMLRRCQQGPYRKLMTPLTMSFSHLWIHLLNSWEGSITEREDNIIIGFLCILFK